MNGAVNPFDHLTEAHLKRQLTTISRRMVRDAKRGKTPSNFEEQRVLMLSISDSLNRKREVAWLDTIAEIDTTDEV